MSYKHLNKFEHARIEVLLKMGYSTRQIIKYLSPNHSIINRELKRNTRQTYHPDLADELDKQRLLVCHSLQVKCEEVVQIIQLYLKLI